MEHLLQFINPANTPQNTGGGTSHNSTVVTPVWKGSRPTVSRRSTDSQPKEHRTHTLLCKTLKYAAMILLLLTLGVGNAWGESPFNVTPSACWETKDGILVAGNYQTSNKMKNNTTESLLVNNSAIHIFSENTNITGISFDVCRNSDSSSENNAVSVQTSTGGAYSVPTSGFTATKNSSSLTSLSNITAIGRNQSTVTSISISFSSPVKAIEIVKASASSVANISITYSAPSASVYYAASVIGSANDDGEVTTDPGEASVSFDHKVTSTKVTLNGNIYAGMESGNSTINLGSGHSFQVGDQIIFNMTWNSTSSGQTGGVVIKATENITKSLTNVNSTEPFEVCYVVTADDGIAGQQSCSFTRTGGNSLIHGVRVVRASGGGDPAPSCTSPTIAWATEPADATEGAADATASVTTTPTPYSVSWTSNNTSVATVDGGTISYVAPGFAKITASLTYSGEDYCEETVNVEKDIRVLIDAITPGANDKLWYYTSAKPSSSPDDGLNFANSKEGSGMYGIKLNSSGYAWFEKPAVSGKLRVGAYASGTDPYVVNVYACNNEGTISGDALGTLSTPRAGGVSTTMNIAADVEGIRINRSTNSEGVLYFIEFEADPVVVCGATAPGAISAGALTNGEITLTASGSVETGDIWYWQSSASGTDKTTSGSSKTVITSGTYYIRSYNTSGDCWSEAKSITLTAEDFIPHYAITYNKGTYGTGSIDAGDKTEDVDFTLSSEMFTRENYLQVGWATTDGTTRSYMMGGSYTTNAAQIFYPAWAEKETYEFDADNEKTITALKAEGWTFNSDVFDGDPADSECYVNTVGAMNTAGLTAPHGNSMDDNAIAFAKNTDAYALFDLGFVTTVSSVTGTFNVGSGKARTFTIQYLGADGSTVLHSTTVNHPENSNWGADALNETEVVANVRYIKIKSVAEKSWLVMSTFSVTYGNLIPKYNLSFAAGTGASGSMSTLKYAEGAEVTLPACTFTAPTGKEFDAWVVTKTVSGASVTVTNGAFTMPAVAVTATATWKDRPKHTDATLSDLTVAGETVTGFAAATTSYNVELPFGTTSAPIVAATATDASYVKSVVVTQASSTSSDATVVVTAEDGTTTKTYTIHFSVEATKDLILVYKTGQSSCVGSDATVAKVSAFSQYIEKTAGTEADNSSINTTATQGGKITISAKPGYAIKSMSFYGKVEDGSCGISLDGADATTLEKDPQVKTDDCYTDVFTNAEAHSFSIINTGTHGVWVRSMKLTMIQACTAKTIAWTAEPAAEYEVGASVDPIAASANNGTVSYASTDGDVIAVNSSNGALTLKALGTVALSASVPAGDGMTYCDEGAQVSKANVKTYYLVTFNAQNETTPATVKYYKNDAAIALPSTPEYSGYTFQGWYDAPSGGSPVTSAITPSSSRTIYAQWEAQCAGPTITTQPASANYLTGRTATALTGAATAGNEGALTYTWYSCDDAERTNPVELAGAPTPSTAVAGTQYYYFTVQEAGCDVVRTSNVATITVTDKDPVCIIKATPTSGTEATVDGAYKGDAYFKGRASDYKLNSGNDYVGVELASGYTFLATDKVVLNQVADLGTDDIKKFYVYSEVPADGKTYVTITNASPVKGDNWFDMPAEMAGESAFYIGRKDANCNPTVGYLAVYRVMMPELLAITIDGRAGELDALAENTFNVTIPYEAELTSLTDVPTIARNAAHATTPQAVITNDGEWVLGDNTYRVMDKDGDYTDYTINLTRALPDAETPVIATDLTDHAYCAGDEPELDATANAVSDGGTVTYQWYDAEGAIDGATNAKYTPAGEGSYYCKVTNTLAEHRPMTTTSSTAVLTQKAATSISGDTEFEIEQGATVKFQPTITGANATYAWYACDAEGNHEGDALGTKASYTTATLNDLGTFYYVLEVTADCGSESQVFSVTVSDLGGSLVAHRPGNYYGQTLKEYDGRYYEIYGFASSASNSNFLWAGAPTTSSTDQNCVLAFDKSGETTWLKNSVNGRGSSYSSVTNADQFNNGSCSGYKMNYRTGNSLILKVKGYDQFSMYSKDNGSAKYFEVQIDNEVVKSSGNSSWALYNYDLADGEHIIVVRGIGDSNNEFSQFSLRLPVVAKVDETNIVSVQNAIDAASDPITITMVGNSYEDIVIENGKDVTIAGAGHTLNSITVENGGKVNASSAMTLVENLYLEAQAGASGQVLGATNVTANAVYMDVTFFKGATELDETTAGRWYMISAPFDVNLNGGFSLPDGTPMTFGTSDGENIFDLFEYDGSKRATTGVTGWKRPQGKMHAGRACLIGFNPGQATTIRLKAAGTTLSDPSSITLNEYAGDDANQNWNGVANPTLHYTDLSCDVQTYNNEDGENGRKYIAYSASSTSFVVGTAFFVQATGTIDLSAASHSEFRAPQRQANERYEACVRIFRDEATEFADQMYVRASENASSEYEQGHDMITWNGTTANTAMIWAENYGKRLAIEEAPLVNDKASYALGIYAPKAGDYRIATLSEDNADIYLTYEGSIIWNLSMGEYLLTLDKGNNNGYGLLLQKKAPMTPTGVENIESGVQGTTVQKVVIDNHVFILRAGQMYDVTGKMVK